MLRFSYIDFDYPDSHIIPFILNFTSPCPNLQTFYPSLHFQGKATQSLPSYVSVVSVSA